MSLSRLREVVEGRGAWRAAGRGVTVRRDLAPELQRGTGGRGVTRCSSPRGRLTSLSLAASGLSRVVAGVGVSFLFQAAL